MEQEILQEVLIEISNRLKEIELKLANESNSNTAQNENKLLMVAVEKLYDEFGTMKNVIDQSNDKIIQNIETLNKSNNANAASTLSDIPQKLEKVHVAVRNIPQQIKVHHTHEYKHINAGVRFVLIVLVTVILTASGFCWYWMTKYNEYKTFSENYEWYSKQLSWDKYFFNFMQQKNPRDTKAFLEEKPMPEN